MSYFKSYYSFVNESLTYSKGIKQSDVLKTQENILETVTSLFRIPEDKFAFIGSAGKKKDLDDYSSNINLAVDINSLKEENNLDVEEINDFIKNQFKRINLQCEINEDVILIKWHINGDDKLNEYVEVLLQLTDSLEWIKFSRYSPNLNENESEYVGKYREAVFKAISKTIKKDIVSYFDTNENVKEFEVYYYDSNLGLGVATKTFEGKNGILKKSLLLEKSKRILTKDPKEVVNVLFGESFAPDDVNTFEKCLEAIKSKDFQYPKKRDSIMKKIKKEIVEFRLEIPESLM